MPPLVKQLPDTQRPPVGHTSPWLLQPTPVEVAQQLFCPETIEPHQASIDHAHIKGLIKVWNPYASAEEQEAKIEDLLFSTRTLLGEAHCTAAVHALADTLFAEKRLTGDRTRELILDAMRTTNESMSDLLERISCPHCQEYDE